MRTYEIREQATGRIVTAVRAEDEQQALDVAAAEAGYGSFAEMAMSLDDDASAYAIHQGEIVDEPRSGSNIHKRSDCPHRPLYRQN